MKKLKIDYTKSSCINLGNWATAFFFIGVLGAIVLLFVGVNMSDSYNDAEELMGKTLAYQYAPITLLVFIFCGLILKGLAEILRNSHAQTTLKKYEMFGMIELDGEPLNISEVEESTDNKE